MEQGIAGFDEKVRRLFLLGEAEPERLSPLTLAFVGDAVYELVIRSYVTGLGNAPAGRLHLKARNLVNAVAQSDLVMAVIDELRDEEKTIYKRGRNTRVLTRAKNAGIREYRRATGLEALCGYLYLKGDTERILEIIHRGLEKQGLL